jgi:hypothetical protein
MAHDIRAAWHTLAVAALLLALVGCAGSSTSGGSQGRPSVAVATSVIPPGSTCPNGGIQVDSGIDDNGNGVLDPGEVDTSQAVCHGLDALVATTAEPRSIHCPNGGLRVDSGVDLDADDTLDSNEVLETQYVCAVSGSGTNQGSPDPVVVPLDGSKAFNDLVDATVAAWGSSYYRFVAPTNDTTDFGVSVGNNATDLAWNLYGNAEFTSLLLSCDNLKLGADEYCVADPLIAGTTYYLQVLQNDGAADTFEIYVAKAQY